MAKACARAFDQQLSDDMTKAEATTTVLDHDSVSPESQAQSVQLYFVLIMLSIGRALDRIAIVTHGWGMEAWLLLPEEQREAGRDDAGSVGVSSGHERCGQQSGHDGTKDEGILEAREHQHSGFPQGRYRDSADGRGTDDNALHHECATFRTSKPK